LPLSTGATTVATMTGSFARGLLAGAAGTTALTAVTYLDLALRGRPASTLPEETSRRAGRPGRLGGARPRG